MHLPVDSAIPQLGIYSEDILNNIKYICTEVLIAPLFVVAKYESDRNART